MEQTCLAAPAAHKENERIMHLWHKKTLWGLALVGVLVLGSVIVTLVLTAGSPRTNSANGAEPAASGDGTLAVKTIRPKCDPSFALSVQEPAQVMPYYLAELEAQVAGRVEFIRKAAGSPVKAGELLAKVAVPDLDQDVALKQAVVEQKQKEWELAQKNVRIAKAAVTAAENNIEVKKAEVDVADSIRNYREKEYTRLQRLIQGGGATQQIVDEQEQNYLAAVGDVNRAKKAVLKAKSDLAEAQAKLEAADADVKLKQALITAAEKDRDKAQALANYSAIRSNFDGQVKRRHADPGSLVRVGESVLTVQRTDIVTVTMKVPDTFAPYVGPDTEAVIELSKLPGQLIHGKVTRFSPSLQTAENDHTMLVEVDLYNGTEKEYQDFLATENAKKAPQAPFDDLKEGPLPLFPKVTGQKAVTEPGRLIPGMYGLMRLVFRKLPQVFLVPSDAIVREGGTPYLYLVKGGKAVRVQVAVEVDDQKLAKVSVIENVGREEVRRPLTGDEEIVYSNQGELSDGQAVKTIPIDWQPRE
jgi:multidrug resistance efflux pump